MTKPQTLKRRREFLSCAKGRRWAAKGLVLQARARPAGEGTDAGAIRIGYTCSKKLGNAVARNRAKRRLRAIAAQQLPELGKEGWDYVLIGRPGSTIARSFPELLSDLDLALKRVHEPRRRQDPR